ncbi:unnamed protein product [Linum trigynum]|uniref:Uncharacterized protein n=1 Tax=Linum trigynum TaxID=586398 RepID=A0AAV2FT19_9ROSI
MGARNHTQTSVKMEQPAPSKEAMESVALGGPVAYQGRGSEKMPMSRGSPRGFALNRPPKVRLGNGQSRQLGKKLQESPCAGEAARPQSLTSARLHSAPLPSGDPPAMIQEDSRRRRLILEKDSDDHMVDAIPTAAHATSLQSMQEGSSADQVDYSIPKVAGVEKSVKQRARRAKYKPLQKQGEDAAFRAGVEEVEGLVNSQPMPSRGNRKLHKAKARVANKAHVAMAF